MHVFKIAALQSHDKNKYSEYFVFLILLQYLSYFFTKMHHIGPKVLNKRNEILMYQNQQCMQYGQLLSCKRIQITAGIKQKLTLHFAGKLLFLHIFKFCSDFCENISKKLQLSQNLYSYSCCNPPSNIPGLLF